MIELTEQQAQALECIGAAPPEITNPRTRETYVLVPVEEYRRLREELYDDSPWTTEELYLLAWESGKYAGWEDLDDYDDFPESP